MFDAYIAFHARLTPDAPAIVTPARTLSFARMDADIDRMAAALDPLAVAADSAVAVDVADEYARWLVYHALARRGIAAAPAADLPSRTRIADRAGSAAAPALLLDEARVAAILRAPARPAPRAHVDPHALGRVLRSSGTTGEEKRIAMSWRRLDLSIRNSFVAYGMPRGPWAPLVGTDAILGLVLALAAWASGNPVVLGLGLAITPALADRVAPALVPLVPDQLRRWVELLPDDAPRRQVRVVSGGGAIPPPLAARVRQRLTDDLRSVYGASETGAVAIANLDLLARHPHAAGYVMPDTEVEIVDAADRPVPVGTRGRVRIRGDRVAPGYMEGASAGASGFRDGWFVPGDVGRLDADGLLLIDGRADEMMNIAGHKLLPGWIEAAALVCPGVADAAAFAVTDASGLQRCWLAVVPGADFAEAALMATLRRPALAFLDRLEWIGVNEIPRGAMGKVRRDRLVELVRERFAGRD